MFFFLSISGLWKGQRRHQSSPNLAWRLFTVKDLPSRRTHHFSWYKCCLYSPQFVQGGFRSSLQKVLRQCEQVVPDTCQSTTVQSCLGRSEIVRESRRGWSKEIRPATTTTTTTRRWAEKCCVVWFRKKNKHKFATKIFSCFVFIWTQKHFFRVVV